MAVSKALASSTLIVEMENGLNSKGVMTHKKKSFSGVKGSADVQNLYDVADAIAVVLKNSTRDYFLNDSNMLINDEA